MMTKIEALNELKLQSKTLESMILYNRDFNSLVDDLSLITRKNAIDIGIKALELQISMEKHCNSHDCIDCRTLGMCASTFMLDELQ